MKTLLCIVLAIAAATATYVALAPKAKSSLDNLTTSPTSSSSAAPTPRRPLYPIRMVDRAGNVSDVLPEKVAAMYNSGKYALLSGDRVAVACKHGAGIVAAESFEDALAKGCRVLTQEEYESLRRHRTPVAAPPKNAVRLAGFPGATAERLEEKKRTMALGVAAAVAIALFAGLRGILALLSRSDASQSKGPAPTLPQSATAIAVSPADARPHAMATSAVWIALALSWAILSVRISELDTQLDALQSEIEECDTQEMETQLNDHESRLDDLEDRVLP